MKKWVRLTAFFLISISVLTACSGPASEKQVSQPQPRPVRLRLLTSWGGVDAKADTLQAILDRFMEKHPGVEVVNESMFGEDFLSKLKTDFASNNEQDVFGLWPGSDIRSLVRAGKVADISDALSADPAWKAQFDPQGWSYTTYNGRIYGLPMEVIFEGLFVNQRLLARVGKQVPDTWEALLETVRALRSSQITPMAWNALAEGTYLYQNLVAGIGSRDDIQNPYLGGEPKACWLRAADYVRDLYRAGAFPAEAFTLSSKERNDLFKQEKAAMIVQGSWFIGDLAEISDHVSLVAFPAPETGDKARSLVYGFGNGTFSVSQKAWNQTERRNAATDLLKALTSERSAELLAQQTGMISNIRLPDDARPSGRLNDQARALLGSGAERVGPPDSYVDRSAWENVIVKQFPYVLEGRLTAAQMWQEAIRNSRVQ